jgi:RNase P subunit RPR2
MTSRSYTRLSTRFENNDIDAKTGPKSSFCRKCAESDWRTYPRMLSTHLSAELGAQLLRVRVGRLMARIPVVHRDLWKVLRPHALNVVMGPVTTEVGEMQQLMLDWTVLLFPRELRVNVRGDEPPGSNWHCKECGDIKYVPFGRMVLVESDIPQHARVLVDGCMLLIDSTLYPAVAALGFKDIIPTEIPVVPRPLDGLETIGGNAD